MTTNDSNKKFLLNKIGIKNIKIIDDLNAKVEFYSTSVERFCYVLRRRFTVK